MLPGFHPGYKLVRVAHPTVDVSVGCAMRTDFHAVQTPR